MILLFHTSQMVSQILACLISKNSSLVVVEETYGSLLPCQWHCETAHYSFGSSLLFTSSLPWSWFCQCKNSEHSQKDLPDLRCFSRCPMCCFSYSSTVPPSFLHLNLAFGAVGAFTWPFSSFALEQKDFLKMNLCQINLVLLAHLESTRFEERTNLELRKSGWSGVF